MKMACVGLDRRGPRDLVSEMAGVVIKDHRSEDRPIADTSLAKVMALRLDARHDGSDLGLCGRDRSKSVARHARPIHKEAIDCSRGEAIPP